MPRWPGGSEEACRRDSDRQGCRDSFRLFPGYANVDAILATFGFPKALAKTNFRRIAIWAVAARYLGPVGHHPCRITLLVNDHIGGG
jgi:hypothetical protein